MSYMVGGEYQAGAKGRLVPIAGAPVAGTDEVQTLTIGGTPTGGTFKISFGGKVTGAITWSATNATLLANIQAAIDAAYGTNSAVAAAVALTAGIGTISLTFSGVNHRKKAQSLASAVENAMTGTAPTAVIAETTPGVDASFRSQGTGFTIVRQDTGQIYSNSSTTQNAPTWTEK